MAHLQQTWTEGLSRSWCPPAGCGGDDCVPARGGSGFAAAVGTHPSGPYAGGSNQSGWTAPLQNTWGREIFPRKVVDRTYSMENVIVLVSYKWISWCLVMKWIFNPTFQLHFGILLVVFFRELQHNIWHHHYLNGSVKCSREEKTTKKKNEMTSQSIRVWWSWCTNCHKPTLAWSPYCS